MVAIQCVKFLKIGIKDQPGALLSAMQDLKTKSISLKGLWGFSKQGGEADLFVIAKDTDKVKNIWTTSGMAIEEGTAFFLKGTDKAGALLKSLEALANAGVNIIAIMGVAVSGKYGSMLWVDNADIEKATKALGAK